MRLSLPCALLLTCLLMPAHAATVTTRGNPKGQPVVLLHGLARSAGSMEKMAAQLASAGYAVCNIDYPSRKYRIEVLAKDYVAPAIRRCFPKPTAPIAFVTHSMGGIVLRQLAATNALPSIGRAVMLSPPNQGSAVVDRLGGLAPFRWLNGPAGAQLATVGANTVGARRALPQQADVVGAGHALPQQPNAIRARHALPQQANVVGARHALPQQANVVGARHALPLLEQLGPAPFELGIITGTRSINLLLSLLLTGPNDGKVTVESAQLQGMKAFLTVPVSHPFIMQNHAVMAETLYFLQHGTFTRTTPPSDLKN